MSAGSGFRKKLFHTKHRRNRSSFYRVCSACETQKPCHRCNVRKPVTEFTASAWKARHANRRICKTCMKKGQWTCAICHLSLAHMEFSAWLRRRPSGQQDGTQECNRCVQSHPSSPTPCGVQPHGRGSARTRRRTARQRAILAADPRRNRVRRPKQKGNDAKRHLPPGIPWPGHDTSDGKRAKLQNCKDAPETETSATAADRRRTGAGPSQDETRKDAPNGCSNTNVSWLSTYVPIVKPASRAQLEWKGAGGRPL